MVSKQFRTKRKYAEAAAELDIIDECLTHIESLKEVLPATEIDYLIGVRERIIKQKVMLESKACNDFKGTYDFKEAPIHDIFFKPYEYKFSFDDFTARYNDMISWLSIKRKD